MTRINFYQRRLPPFAAHESFNQSRQEHFSHASSARQSNKWHKSCGVRTFHSVARHRCIVHRQWSVISAKLQILPIISNNVTSQSKSAILRRYCHWISQSRGRRKKNCDTTCRRFQLMYDLGQTVSYHFNASVCSPSIFFNPIVSPIP